MCEGVLLGVIGALLGVTIALLAAYVINHSGLTWTPPGYVVAYPLRIRVWGDVPLVIGSAIGLVVVAVISAWWPANRAIDPRRKPRNRTAFCRRKLRRAPFAAAQHRSGDGQFHDRRHG